MKTGYLITKGLFIVTMGVMLMQGGVFGNLAKAGGCPDNAAAIEDFADCAPCHIDLNGDGSVTVTDLVLLKKCVQAGCEDGSYDVNGDGKVDQDDEDVLLKCLKMSIKK